MSRQIRKWTSEEDDILLKQVQKCPQNLNHCFLAVAQNINRTTSAIASHWYTVVSKRPDVVCFFTASQHHVSKNRKNGKGVATSESIWQKLLRIIRSL